MTTLFDTAGSFLAGFFVIFILMQLNIQILRTNNELLYYSISQLSTASSCEILEYDIYKVGYRVTSADKFLFAKEDEVKYLSDLDDNGTVDTVYYYLGDTTALTMTINPNDKPLYRKVNNGKPEMISIVTNFSFAYIDSSGMNKISYADLSGNPNKMRSIKGIEAYATVESTEPVNDVYQSSEVVKRIFPKNIK
jgi:hypothetical protein